LILSLFIRKFALYIKIANMVIQRWQSLFLLLAGVAMAVFTFSSLGEFHSANTIFGFNTWGVHPIGKVAEGAQELSLNTLYLAMLSAISALLPLIGIFLFRNLKRQKKVCSISILLNIATVICVALLGNMAVADATIQWSPIVFAPLAAAVLCFMARKGIVRDYNLIASADRIR
jgi:hypothetical protein